MLVGHAQVAPTDQSHGQPTQGAAREGCQRIFMSTETASKAASSEEKAVRMKCRADLGANHALTARRSGNQEC